MLTNGIKRIFATCYHALSRQVGCVSPFLQTVPTTDPDALLTLAPVQFGDCDD